MSNSVAVVTAITGRYDGERKDVFTDGVDYLFYSDPLSADLAPGWTQLTLELNDDTEWNSRLRAKGPKLNPHRFPELRSYEYVIWVDGGCQIISESFVNDFLAWMYNGMVISPHFDGRKDAYGEAQASGGRKYEDCDFKAQTDYYHSRDFPGHNGLFECGVMARDMRHPVVPELGALWEQQVRTWTYQDQISLPYCMWRLNYTPAVLPKSFRDYGWVAVHGHTRDD